MTSLHDIQKFICNTVKNDTDFNTLAVEKLGKNITYFVDAHILDESEEIPSFVAYGLETLDEKHEKYHIVQYVITHIVENRYQTVDGLNIYPTKNSLEILAIESLKLIENEIKNIGINGNCNIKVGHWNLSLSPIGEADDVQAVVTLRLEERKFI
jgi:hypothetical protein